MAVPAQSIPAILLIALLSLVDYCNASATCDTLQSTTNITIEYPLSVSYIGDQFEYWSSDCGRLLPSCILVPTTSSEVSTIITTLLTTNETFAVKSGGHNPNQYYSSVDGGPLISLRACLVTPRPDENTDSKATIRIETFKSFNLIIYLVGIIYTGLFEWALKGLNEVVYDEVTSTARVGPGNRWSEVVEQLQDYGVTAVGGRIGHVGVGGYILGGGLSYLSTEYGWAMNNVVEFEVVLANGTLVTATNTTNVDLFQVLKGGGNNFGIVTSYTLNAYPMGTTDAILTAIQNFTSNYPSDKAAIITTHEIIFSNPLEIWILFLFYDGPSPTHHPPSGTFDMFLDLEPTTLNTQINSAVKDLFAGIREREQAFVGNGTLVDAYVPLFMNDANFQQDYWGRLRPESLSLASAVRDSVDPEGFFRDRTGGFKMS